MLKIRKKLKMVSLFVTHQFFEILFDVLFSLISILDGHVWTTPPDTGLFAPPTSSELEHVPAVLASATVGQLTRLTYPTPTSLGGRGRLAINLI